MSKRIIHILSAALILAATGSMALAQSGGITVQSLQLSSPQQQQEAYQKMTPAQRSLVEAEMQRSGGQLTPEALQALKNRPEFKGLTPDDVAKGRQLQQETKERAKTEPEDGKEKTFYDRARNIGKYQDISLDLKRFGADFFAQAEVKVALDRKDMPVPASYVVGPGDEIKILLWGRVNAQYSLIVDRDGKITIPQIGPLFVAGMTFEQMSKAVIKQAEQIVGANVDIAMGSPKSIPIFVIGDVKRPGAYTIGSFATITDALLIAGGPTEIGSMRHIQLKRKGRLAATFDLYDLLLKGDKGRDATLMAGDVVFVPVTGPLAGIAGNIKRPAVYELKDRQDLEYLIELAGGIIPSAYTQQIQIERIVKNERHVIVDIDDRQMTKAAAVRLQDADLIKIFPIMDMNVNVVYLNGNVKRPGKYEMKAGMRLGDLIRTPDDLLSETYFDYALIKRLDPIDQKTVLIPVNLGNLLFKKDNAANPELTPRDSIYIFNRWFFKDNLYVKIEGEIRGECFVAPQRDEESDRDRQSTIQPTGQSITQQAEMGRTDYREKQKPSFADLAQNLTLIEEELKKQGLFDLAKSARDIQNSIYASNRYPAESLRNLRGELIKVGRPDLANQVQDSENKVQKGSLLIGAIREMEAIEASMKRLNMFNLVQMIRDISDEMKNFNRVPTENMRLLRAELLKVNQPDLANRILEVEQRLRVSCSLAYVDNMRVKDAILLSGGLTKNTYLDKAEIIRTTETKDYRTLYFNVAKAMAGDPAENLLLKSEDRIVIHSIWENVYRKNVEIDGEVAKPGSYQYTDGMTVRDLVFKGGNILESAYVEEAELSSIYAEERKDLKTERKVINLKRALEGDMANNLPLRPNDRLLVKRIPNWGSMKYVTLTGEFRFPGRYAIQKGERLSSVIERAGGYTTYAYVRGAFFTRDTVRQIQQKSLDEMAQRMERELLSESSARIASSVSGDEMQAKKAEAEMKQKLISYMRQLKATGRMTIALTHVRMLKGSPYDIEMEDGDTLLLPRRNNAVNVVGAVMSEGSHLYNENWNYKDYIGMTGGYARYADEANTFVLKVDGSARKLSQGFMTWSDRQERWEVAAFGQKTRQIEPGDVIIVPEKISQIAWLREIRDITQILMNAAVTAGVVIKLF